MIETTSIAVNRYAPEGSNSINLYSTGADGGGDLTLGQLAIAVSLRSAAAFESQSVVKMNETTRGAQTLSTAANWLEKIIEDTAGTDWAAAKAFAVDELGVKDSALPADIQSYDNRMKAAADSYSALILPGGGGGTENMKRSPALIDRIRRQKDENGLICAICAAPTVLVRAGVLDPGQHITCYPTCARELDRPPADAPVVSDGDVITGQAPGAALLFSLVVLKSLVGDYMTRRVAEGMVTDVMM